MSLLDYLGPVILCVLVGVAVLVLAVAYVKYKLIPQARLKNLQIKKGLAQNRYNNICHQIVSELMSDPSYAVLLPDSIKKEIEQATLQLGESLE